VTVTVRRSSRLRTIAEGVATSIVMVGEKERPIHRRRPIT